MPNEELIILIEQRLRDQHPDGTTISVVPEGIRHEDDWWYLPVKPDRQPSKRFEYYETLANVETILAEQDHLTVLFIPIRPEGEAAA